MQTSYKIKSFTILFLGETDAMKIEVAQDDVEQGNGSRPPYHDSDSTHRINQ
jgi:hypothetical protein